MLSGVGFSGRCEAGRITSTLLAQRMAERVEAVGLDSRSGPQAKDGRQETAPQLVRLGYCDLSGVDL